MKGICTKAVLVLLVAALSNSLQAMTLTVRSTSPARISISGNSAIISGTNGVSITTTTTYSSGASRLGAALKYPFIQAAEGVRYLYNGARSMAHHSWNFAKERPYFTALGVTALAAATYGLCWYLSSKKKDEKKEDTNKKK